MDRRALAAWYDDRRTRYPWRADRPDPYLVLVSEVMLQQTQASRVQPAFERFVARFPTVRALAEASRGEVLRAWAGLGYNRRAVALSEAARRIVADHGGAVPDELEDLRRLPGVGPYTAAAVASLAFGAAVPALDTNVRRVVARSELGVEPHQTTAGDLARAAHRALDRRDPGASNQALMDVGREHCRPRPRCLGCPLRRGCRFRRSGRVPSGPVRAQPRFEGSTRQARGALVAALRDGAPSSLGGLAARAGLDLDRAAATLAGLVADGLVSAGPVALAGGSTGRVRLPH